MPSMNENGQMIEDAESAVDAAPDLAGPQRPSRWSALWAAAALGYLMFARRSFRRLG